MTDKSDTEPGAEWQKLHQQYMDALSSFFPRQPGPDTDFSSPSAWNDALDYWWNSVQGELDSKNRPVLEAILKQSQIFYSITEQFAGMFREIGMSADGEQEWQKILERNLEKMKQMFDQYTMDNQMTGTAPAFMWTYSMDSWKKIAADISGTGNGLPDLFPGMQDYMDRYLATPGIGLTAEYQDKMKKSARLWQNYQAASYEYSKTFAELGKQAVDRLRDKILTKAEKNEKISTLRQIYNMWIDANEDVFAEYVSGQEYPELYANLVNALIEFKLHTNDLSDEALRVMNVPTSSGVDSLTRQQHQLKKDIKTTMNIQLKTLKTLQQVQADLRNLQDKIYSTGKEHGSNIPLVEPKSTENKKPGNASGEDDE